MNSEEDMRARRAKNLELWDRVFATDPSQTKTFRRAGGFSGTSIKPYWSIMRATEEFGPIGQGWGWQEIEHKIYSMSNEQAVWFSKVLLWYRVGDQTFQVGPQWGATELVARRGEAKVLFMDEEAAKKAVTDAITKCLSYLGFAGDVHMGLFDDSKYVAERKIEERKEREAEAEAERKAKKAATIKKQPAEDLSNGDAEAGAPAVETKRDHVGAGVIERALEEAESQDPANAAFSARAWFERVSYAFAQAKDQDDVMEIWDREKLIAKKLAATKDKLLAAKAFDLAKARRDELRGQEAAE